MLDALKEEAWLVPAVLGMAVALKQLSVQADEEQARKGQGANQVRVACAGLACMAPWEGVNGGGHGHKGHCCDKGCGDGQGDVRLHRSYQAVATRRSIALRPCHTASTRRVSVSCKVSLSPDGKVVQPVCLQVQR